MAEFNIRSDSVDVEQIMKQIRARIREKRGVDYTEEQVRELATVRLEKFLDPKNLRSDLLEQFRKSRPAPPVVPSEPQPVEAPYAFDDQTLFASHRGPLRLIRKLLRPVLKLLFNPNTLNQILHTQAQFNVDMLKRDQRRKIEMQIFDRSRAEWNVLYYEVLHNLVLETTRNGIELKNLKMRVEALASRLDFSERRVRALEGVVQYRPEAVRPRERGRERQQRPDEFLSGDADLTPVPGESTPGAPVASGGLGQAAPGESGSRRRRRRRRGRRGVSIPPGSIPASTERQSEAGAEDEFEGPEDVEASEMPSDLETAASASEDARDAADDPGLADAGDTEPLEDPDQS